MRYGRERRFWTVCQFPVTNHSLACLRSFIRRWPQIHRIRLRNSALSADCLTASIIVLGIHMLFIYRIAPTLADWPSRSSRQISTSATSACLSISLAGDPNLAMRSCFSCSWSFPFPF